MASDAIRVYRHAYLKSAEIVDTEYNLLIHVQPLHHLIASLCGSHLIWKVETLLPTLTRHPRMSQDHVFHIICCLMSTEMSYNLFKLNDIWSFLLKNFFQSCCIKYEILADFMTNLIGNGFYKEAKSEYNSVWAKRTMTYVTEDIFEQIANSCVALCDYMVCVDELSSSYQPSQQNYMILDQVVNIWKTILKNKPGPLDFLIPRILDIYIHNNEIDEALECLIAYKDLNSDNLNAYIYIFKFLVKYKKADPKSEKIIEDCFHKVAQLSPCSPLIIEMLDYCKVGSRYTCTILMEFVDFFHNKENLEAWKKLCIHLERLDILEWDTIKESYKSIYSSYWPEYHWKSLESRESSELLEWKEKVYQMLVSKPKNLKHRKNSFKVPFRQKKIKYEEKR